MTALHGVKSGSHIRAILGYSSSDPRQRDEQDDQNEEMFQVSFVLQGGVASRNHGPEKRGLTWFLKDVILYC